MAGILDEFDEATPLRRAYCSRLTLEEYEDEGSSYTEKALSELVAGLDRKPDTYKKVLERRKKEEVEEGGVLTYVKAKLWTWIGGEDVCAVSDAECDQKLRTLKEDMMKAFDYSEESKGRRFSRRIAEKRRTLEASTPRQRRQENSIPPPPPPPPPPPSVAVPLTPQHLSRRPLSKRREVGIHPETCSEPYKHLLHQLKDSGQRKRLRKTVERSPGGTPYTGWSRAQFQPDIMPYFNAKLIAKFQNARSPVCSPQPTLASPGTFGSPLDL